MEGIYPNYLGYAAKLLYQRGGLMKANRLCDLISVIAFLPVVLIVGMLGGLTMAWVAWNGKLKLSWDMRNSAYVWEDGD
jgi:hypothetical protein